MSRQPARRPAPLTVEAITDAAGALIAAAGLEALSMRKLGAALDVDPMAIYHHVRNKRELLALVTARVVGAMEAPSPSDPWDERVRGWATAYREVVAANRELVAAGLTDPVIAAGGTPLIAPLLDAVVDSGTAADHVEATAWLVVDFVHGAALASPPLGPPGFDPDQRLVGAFRIGLDTIIAGIAANAARTPPSAAARTE